MIAANDPAPRSSIHPEDSMQQLWSNVEEHRLKIDARVCHLRSADPRLGGEALIRLEYVPTAAELSR
jgi:hypothetical protein